MPPEPPKSESDCKASAQLTRAQCAARGLLVIGGRAYDGKAYLSSHPGGAVISTYLGADATDVYRAFHFGSKRSADELEPLFVAEVEAEVKKAAPSFEQDMRSLTAKFVAAGLFKTDPLYYVVVVTRTLAIAASAAALALWAGPNAPWLKLVAALLLGIYRQQFGWIAHDFVHNQVFADRSFSSVVALFAGVCGGYSVQWWKDQHNLHHAVPNLEASLKAPTNGDPDIDTLPYLAWSRTMLARVAPTLLARTLVAWQKFVYFPLLLLVQAVWNVQSVRYVLRAPRAGTPVSATSWRAARPLMHPIAEPLGLFLYWALLGLLLWRACDSVAEAAAFFVVSHGAAGLLIAIVFGVGHNGMEYFDAADPARPGFAEQQVRTSRDIANSPLVSFFMGGLQFQIEHHLFPGMPRHALAASAPLVRELCRRHGVPYHCTGLWEGTREVLAHLGDVAQALSEHGPL